MNKLAKNYFPIFFILLFLLVILLSAFFLDKKITGNVISSSECSVTRVIPSYFGNSLEIRLVLNLYKNTSIEETVLGVSRISSDFPNSVIGNKILFSNISPDIKEITYFVFPNESNVYFFGKFVSTSEQEISGANVISKLDK